MVYLTKLLSLDILAVSIFLIITNNAAVKSYKQGSYHLPLSYFRTLQETKQIINDQVKHQENKNIPKCHFKQ
jgi:hypothetical protein